MHRPSNNSWALLPAVAITAALVLTGCSDDTSSESNSGDTAAVLGPENKATGEPIKIALSSLGKSPQIDNTGEIEAAQAAASYVNDYLGGINGRPLEISLVCETKAQPSLARECANKIVQSDVVALASGPEPNAAAIVDITSPAGLPYFNLNPVQEALTEPNSFVLTNVLGFMVGVPAKYAQEQGFDKVAIVTLDVPAAVEPLQQLGPLIYGNAGASADIVPVPLGTADQTPQIQAALSNDPDMFSIIGDPAFCTSTLKALRTLNAPQPVMVVGQCIGDSTTAAQIPSGYSDLLVSTTSSSDPTQQETEIFNAVIDKYTQSKVTTGTAPSGYQAVLGLARALTGIQGDITRARVAAHLAAMPTPQAMPLGAGATFQCGSTPVAMAPNICARDALLGTATEDGTLTDVTPVDVSALLKLPQA